METFKIEVQEFLARVVEVEAENVSDAISKVKEQYRKTEIVLDYNDFIEVNFIDTESKGDEKEKLMKEVIEYLYSDEKKHFEESGKPEEHIYRKLERLKILLN